MKRLKLETLVGLFFIAAVFIFFYLTFQIGAFRFDRGQYESYTVLFADTFGLTKKDEVKIAGVKIGWIEKINLVSEQKYYARALIKITNRCILHKDARCVIRHDGLLGKKFLEIIPGTTTLPQIAPKSELICMGEDVHSLDGVLGKASGIATQAEELISGFNQAINSCENMVFIKEMINKMSGVVENLADITRSLNDLTKNNQDKVTHTINDLADIIKELKKEIPPIISDIKNLTAKVCDEISPNVENTIERISTRVETVITDMSKKVEATNDQICQIVQKINSGEGTLGKLINDDKPLQDVNVTVKCVQSALSSFEKVRFGCDVAGESLHAFGEKRAFSHDFKGYVNAFVYPRSDYFIMAGLVGDQQGEVMRKDILTTSIVPASNFNQIGHVNGVHNDAMHGDAMYDNLNVIRQDTRAYNHWLWNLQFGKTFDRFQVRAGIFESTAGVAFDVDVPLPNDSGNWITSFEAYDFKGKNRFNDDRAHLRWINRLFFNPSFYLTFGIDDFISRSSKSFFFGAGLCFGSCYFPCHTGQVS